MAPETNSTAQEKQTRKVIAPDNAWLQGILEQRFSQKVSSLVITPTGDETGFLSFCYKLKIKWEQSESDKQQKEPETVFLKMPTSTKVAPPEEQSGPVQGPTVEVLIAIGHQTECKIYQFFAQTDAASFLPVPKSFTFDDSSSENQFILFEDLSHRGRTPVLAEGLTFNQCRNALQKVAQVQAFCLVNGSWKDSLTRGMYSAEGMTGWAAFAKKNFGIVQQSYPGLLSFTAEDLELLTDMNKIMPAVFGEEGLRTIVHGDYWLNNVLLEIDPKKPEKLAEGVVGIVDWQLTYEGCWTKDICFLLVSSLDWKLRQQHENEFLKHFYDCFKQSLTELCASRNLPVESVGAPFTFEALVRLYHRGLTHAAIQFLIQSTFSLVHPEVVKKHSRDSLEDILKRIDSVVTAELIAAKTAKINLKN